MVAVGTFLFRWRNTIFPWLFVALLLPGPRLFADPWHALALSVLVTGLGQTIRALTIGLRYIKRGGRGGKVYANDLVTEGEWHRSDAARTALWANGAAVDGAYVAWAPGEPNDSGDCLVVGAGPAWDDTDCVSHQYVCEGE